MIKGDNGIWSATIGPLKPEYYVYVFVVDGVQTLDPQNIFHVRDGAAVRQCASDRRRVQQCLCGQ